MWDCYIFALENQNNNCMEKLIFTPNDSNAFTSEVMHKVVLNGINFELPEHIWDTIDDAFANYWNVEVGYGGWTDLDSAVSSISNWLKKEHIVFSVDKIADIVNIMFDWIEQIPGATLDEGVSVVPPLLPKLFDFNEPYFDDYMTDFVYISDKLKEFYPNTYMRLTKLFNIMGIEWGEAEGTKDIWIRDYMPIQLDSNSYLFYNYDPDYLKGTSQKYITDAHDVNAICSKIFKWKKINAQRTKYKLDGGNVVACAKHKILTDKVFMENGKEKYDSDFCESLSLTLHSHIIFLPWHCDNPHEYNADVYGHADGMIHHVGYNRVLMSNHRDFFPEEADKIKCRLENAGFKVAEMLFDVPNPNRDFNWAYINYLQVGNKIIVPTFGIPEDKQALKYIQDANPECIVRGFRMRDIVRNGGGLHCITWNIKK